MGLTLGLSDLTQKLLLIHFGMGLRRTGPQTRHRQRLMVGQALQGGYSWDMLANATCGV